MKTLSRVVDWLSFPYGVFLLVKDPDVSTKAKLKASVIMAVLFFYILDPVDLIPDIIPMIGWLEDFFAIPIAMAVMVKVVPEINVPEVIKKARSDVKRVVLWTLLTVASMILLSLVAMGITIYLIVRYWT